jgi:hypothetical protein
MARIARANTSNPADGRLPSSDAKLKLNRLRQRQPVPSVTKERSAALIGKARAAPTGEQKRNSAAPARKR